MQLDRLLKQHVWLFRATEENHYEEKTLVSVARIRCRYNTKKSWMPTGEGAQQIFAGQILTDYAIQEDDVIVLTDSSSAPDLSTVDTRYTLTSVDKDTTLSLAETLYKGSF